ncbi:MAG: hypothetical protein IPO80_12665 [Propionibacteriaceae bacterium]|nr:hypothetical protein [Propionibacteriaceae bacterium]
MAGPAGGPFGAWVLWGDPLEWDLELFRSAGSNELESWPVGEGRRAAAMAVGDPVVLVLTGEQDDPAPGLWGVGRVTGRARSGRPDQFWRERAKRRTLVGVEMVVERVLLGISDLARVEVLAASELVVRPPGGEPGVLTSAQWTALRDLVQGVAVASSGAGRVWNRPPLSLPMRRLLRTYAFDPTSTRLSGEYLIVDVPFEASLRPGPMGELVQVVDFDATRKCWYEPVDLNDPTILARGGLRPAEHDPRTHQQVVYAVSMSVLERFERFAGRRFRWRGTERLKLVPHAFDGRNAFFDAASNAVMFGYYRATRDDLGEHLPGQRIFTCLSSDIIAHEVTHAIMHRWRPCFSEATNPDVFAWHEAFADLVALFQHFVHFDVVRAAVASSAGDLRKSTGLLDLAREFGSSTGRGAALRSALEAERSPAAFRAATEPHQRGAFFVAAVFEAFVTMHQRAIGDLIRIATGGSGVLPPGQLQSDLVNRVTKEAVMVADTLLGVVVRAFDYLPDVDVTFGDVVRAIVTADHLLYPDDGGRLRGTLVEAMRARGIYPEGVTSLADDALMWPAPDRPLSLRDAEPPIDLSRLIVSATLNLDASGRAAWAMGSEGGTPLGDRKRDRDEEQERYTSLNIWARRNAVELGLEPTQPIAVVGVHVAYRQAQDRQPHPEIVIQFRQRRLDLEDPNLSADDRVQVKAGTTLIAGVDGQVLHVVVKPLPFTSQTLEGLEHHDLGLSHHRAGSRRLSAMRSWLGQLDADDALTAWTGEPAALRLDFAALHADPPAWEVSR